MLVSFFLIHGLTINLKNSLRRQFGNCLMWYTHLRNLLRHHYKDVLQTTRVGIFGPEIQQSASPPTPPRRGRTSERAPSARHHRDSSSSSASSSGTPTPAAPRADRSRKRAREPSPESPQVPFPEPPPREHPSEYLRRRCPACFGNLKHDPLEV